MRRSAFLVGESGGVSADWILLVASLAFSTSLLTSSVGSGVHERVASIETRITDFAWQIDPNGRFVGYLIKDEATALPESHKKNATAPVQYTFPTLPGETKGPQGQPDMPADPSAKTVEVSGLTRPAEADSPITKSEKLAMATSYQKTVYSGDIWAVDYPTRWTHCPAMRKSKQFLISGQPVWSCLEAPRLRGVRF